VNEKKPLIIYHRGRHGKGIRIKENTIEAFERAVKEGAKMIEFDVWDDLRIIHDPDPDVPAPTLQSAMDAIHARAAVNIEIKNPSELRFVLDVIDDALTMGCWTAPQIVVSSFHHETAVCAKKVFPEITVGVVNDGVLLPAYIDLLAKEGINNLHLEWANVYMDIADDHAMREAVRANDMHIWVWTVNTKKVFDVVTEYGAEAVFTDKPQLFR